VLTFRRLRPSTGLGLGIGVLWLAINWGLDLLILLPLSGMSAANHAEEIGLRYLLLPIIATGMGAAAGRAAGG
jgi:hypothetical protein